MMPDPSERDLAPLELRYQGRTVLLVTHPPADDRAIRKEDIAATLARSPLDNYSLDRIAAAVDRKGQSVLPVGEVAAPPNWAEPYFLVISPDRSAAYVVPTEPPPVMAEAQPPAPSPTAEIGTPHGTESAPRVAQSGSLND